MDLRIDFIDSIPADHMKNCFITTRMKLQPRIQLQDILVQYDNGMAVLNQILHL